ncbi:MAG: radical SAM protein [Promethearchaeota archaeon]
MIYASFLTILKPDYIEERDGNFLLIWRDLPYWMVIDNEAYQLISLANGSLSLKEIIHTIISNEDDYENKLKESLVLIESFKNLGLTEPKKSTPNSSKITPLFENITLNITRKCNIRCQHCYITDYKSNDILNIEDFINFVIEAEEIQLLAPNLNFTILGGEPLLEKEKTLDIAKFGKERGFDVILSTNGILIDDDFAKKAGKNNLVVQVSLEGSSSEINDHIRGEGNFIKTQKGLMELLKHDIYTILSMVVHHYNFDNIESFYQFGRSLGVNEILFIPLKIMGRAIKNITPVPKRKILHALYELSKKYKDAKDFLKRDYLTIMKTTCAHSNKTIYCGTGLKTILIDADGTVYPCPNHCLPEFSCGNIHSNSCIEILNSPILQILRQKYNVNTINEECSTCVVKHWCAGGCRGEAYANTKSMTSKAIGCEDIYNSIIDTFWILAQEDYTKYPKKREYF